LLQGSDVSEWNRAVAPNLDKYEEVRPGVWELKPEFEYKTVNTMDPASWQTNALPKTVDIRTEKMKEDEKAKTPLQAIVELGSSIPTGFNAGIFGPFGQKEQTPSFSTPGNTFFRNIITPSVQNKDIIAARIKAANKPVVPIVPQFTPEQTAQSIVNFRREERIPLNINPRTTFTPEEIEQSFIDFRRGEREMI
jgi:hypothetical protein